MDSQLLQNEITCQLCRRLATDPRLLDCLHSFCRTCIEMKLQGLPPPTRSHNVKGVVCPVCTHVTTLPTNGGNGTTEILAGNLRKNVVAERLLLNISQSQSDDVGVEETLAIFGNGVHEGIKGQHAVNGKSSKVFCESGSPPHILNGDNSSVVSDFERCALHDAELKKYFCKACRIPLCASCVILDHGKRAHEWTTLSEATESLKEELSDILLEAESRIENVKEGISELEQKIEKVLTSLRT